MAVISIALPYNGQEWVNQLATGGPITPLAAMVDFSNQLLFQVGTAGYVQSADGSIATIGTKADAAWGGGGAAGSAIAVLKAVVNALLGTLKVQDVAVETSLAGTLTVKDTAAEASLAGTLKVQPVGSASVLAGGPTAAPAGGGTIPAANCSSVTVVNDYASTGILFVGNSTTWPIPLFPGQWAKFPVNNLNLVGVKGAAGVLYDYVAVP